MCGIAGFAGEDRARIERMTRCLKHRGPDGNACQVEKGASIGHARLAILDPRPEGDQPMWNNDRTVVIIYNGEIFNYRELRDGLKKPCRTGTDTEVLIRLYEEEGIAFVKRLRGMFAFGLFDTRTRTWYLARDPSGIKPLYVAYPGGRLHFASEMRSLLSAFPEKPALNMRALSLYMRLQYVPGPQTMCEGIESLPPGTVLTWKEGEETRTTVLPDTAPMSFASPADFKERFPAFMNRVVADHLVSDKPVGIFLSGGMDSSIVLHHMVQHTAKPVSTFTVRFEATEEEGSAKFNKDAELAQMTATHYGTQHQEILLTANICREIYRDTARHLDQPNADTVAPAQFLLSREAKKHVDVVLCGAGGDELFGGYHRYRVARILHMLRAVPAPLRAFAGSLAGQSPDVMALQPGPALAERLLARPITEVAALTRNVWFEASATTRLFEEHFAHVDTRDPVRALMDVDRGLWLVDESLRLMDATTMGSGLEARPPFLDPLIIAASKGTQTNWHTTLTKTKTLLKETYRPILPAHLYSLDKAGFFPPFAKWIRRECAPLIEEALENKRIQELFDVDAVCDLFAAHKEKRTYAAHTLSAITQLGFWFEEVYDSDFSHT